jgi:hypothetical protein
MIVMGAAAQLLNENGFPIKGFGNDRLEKDFYDAAKIFILGPDCRQAGLTGEPECLQLKYERRKIS